MLPASPRARIVALACAAALLALALPIAPAAAQNTPCSGRKGGISHCEGYCVTDNGSKRYQRR